MEMNTVSGALRGEGELEGGGLGSACVCLRESEGESEKEGGRNIRDRNRGEGNTADYFPARLTMFLLQTVTVISLTVILLGSVEGNGVQMQRDVQCCMQYSQGKVRTKDVLRFEVQTEGPDCSIKAIILYTKKAVKCADPRDRKVKRLLRKLLQRQRTKAHRIMWLYPHGNLPVMSEDKKDGWDAFHVE
uniref:Chemokine interleukin-8-like domain-containing protein n=2 Tax=Salmoninae TaxID=504568 RepID=A0AAZ3PS03_ONCTS